jgi:hypothetical protein
MRSSSLLGHHAELASETAPSGGAITTDSEPVNDKSADENTEKPDQSWRKEYDVLLHPAWWLANVTAFIVGVIEGMIIRCAFYCA